MKVKHDNIEYDVKFTFNSFRIMEDLDLGVLEEIERTPFKLIPLMEQLLIGGLNHNPKMPVTGDVVYDILEDVVENGDVSKFLEDLMVELEKSSFFKNLQ